MNLDLWSDEQRERQERDSPLPFPISNPYIMLWYTLSDGNTLLVPICLN